LSPSRRRVADLLLCRLDGLIVLGESWRTWVAANTALPANRIHVVNNPIDGEFERAAGTIPPGGSRDVLFLGALAESKGTFDLIRAVALLRDEGLPVTVHMAGPERGAGVRQALEEMVRDLRLTTVTIREPVSGEEKLALVRECGIFALPSYRENFPLGVLEAAAAGRAMVVTPVGATPEFFKDGESVLFVPPGDVERLAAALRRVVESEQLRRQLGTRAREVFNQRLNRERIMESLDAVYRHLLIPREVA
jgi:glycosyltransferase involved in cell wall biosynthesis